jgi:hypothetical protein
MPITSVSLSTSAVPGPSPVAVLNWRGGRPVLFQVTTNSSVATGDFTVQYTLDDVMLTGYSTIYPPVGSPTLASTISVWAAISSTPYTTLSTTGSIGVHFTSSTIFPDGLSGTLLGSPAALRLYSTASSSNTLTLKVVQGDGG